MKSISKDRLVDFLDAVSEWCVYVLLFAVTFSNSIVEIASTVMIAAWLTGVVIRKDIKKLRSSAALMLGAYFIWVLLSVFGSAHANESFRGIFKALQYGLVFLAASTRVWTGAKIRRFLYAAAGAVFLSGANGLFQYVTGEDLLRGRTLIPEDHLRRISSSFIHPNDFGAYLAAMGALFGSMLFFAKNNLKKAVFFLAVTILALACLFLTGSRGAWMSFAAAFMVVGILKGKRIAALFAGLILAIFLLMPSGSRQRIFEVADLQGGTSWERVMIWSGSVDMIRERPILGFGVNTFSKHFPDYKPENYPDDRYAHNCYLQMAAEIGIIGTLFFIAFIAAVFFSSFRGIMGMAGGIRKTATIGLLGGSVGFAFNSAVDTHLFSLSLAVFFNILLGTLFSMSRGKEKFLSE